MIYNNVLEAMGHTPMIRLNHMGDPDGARILVKYEGLNVGGSIKTRTAYNMIVDAEKQGLIGPDTVIVEPTSGNQGIGLALIGAVRGYRTIIIMPDSVSEERRKLVRHYGAEVILIHDAGDIGACIDECLQTALRMAEEDPKVYVPQQFSNPANNAAHRYHTAIEILEQVGGPIDGFCSGVGTGGTISGIGEVLKSQNPISRSGRWSRRTRLFWPEAISAPSADGYRGRPDPGKSESEHIQRYLHYFRRGSYFHSQRPGPEGRADVRHFQRYQRGGGHQAGQEAGPGKNSGDRAAGYG